MVTPTSQGGEEDKGRGRPALALGGCPNVAAVGKTRTPDGRDSSGGRGGAGGALSALSLALR